MNIICTLNDKCVFSSDLLVASFEQFSLKSTAQLFLFSEPHLFMCVWLGRDADGQPHPGLILLAVLLVGAGLIIQVCIIQSHHHA